MVRTDYAVMMMMMMMMISDRTSNDEFFEGWDISLATNKSILSVVRISMRNKIRFQFFKRNCIIAVKGSLSEFCGISCLGIDMIYFITVTVLLVRCDYNQNVSSSVKCCRLLCIFLQRDGLKTNKSKPHVQRRHLL